MNVFNNPQSNSLKILLAILVLSGIAYFSVTASRTSQLDQAARVYEKPAAEGLSYGCGNYSSVVFDATTDSCTVTTCGGVSTVYSFDYDGFEGIAEYTSEYLPPDEMDSTAAACKKGSPPAANINGSNIISPTEKPQSATPSSKNTAR